MSADNKQHQHEKLPGMQRVNITPFFFQASGFCYVNDIVIGILELLK